MAFLKIGKKDRDGRQKRIEHTDPYLRASRTGGLSLCAQTRIAGVNLTGNTWHGLRVSTRLDKNAQVAFPSSRFVLGGGHTRRPLARGLEETRSVAETALLMEPDAATEHWEHWLSQQPPDAYEAVIGIMATLTQTLTQSPQLITQPELLGEILLALDDTCLRDGPKTLLQEVMLDLVAEAMAVEVVREGEA